MQLTNNQYNKRFLREKLYQELGLETLQQQSGTTTLLFLQNTKIAVSEVPLLVYSSIQYVLQDKTMKNKFQKTTVKQ